MISTEGRVLLPPEIVIREFINGGGSTLFNYGGVVVVGTTREIEIVSIRGEVLLRMAPTEIADWVARNHYRYVPGTMGTYQRDAIRRGAPIIPRDGIQRR